MIRYQQEIDRLKQQVTAVSALHVQAQGEHFGPYCKECAQDWPCDTRRALDWAGTS